uniref:Uncharacterized protein n=1 Tax=Meloidogyne incognita TaxID=6306 RepID=A0A914MLD3_MELIC
MYNTQIEIKAHSNVQPASSPCQQAKAFAFFNPGKCSIEQPSSKRLSGNLSII